MFVNSKAASKFAVAFRRWEIALTARWEPLRERVLAVFLVMLFMVCHFFPSLPASLGTSVAPVTACVRFASWIEAKKGE